MTTRTKRPAPSPGELDTLCQRVESLAERLICADSLTPELRTEAGSLLHQLAHTLAPDHVRGSALAGVLEQRLGQATAVNDMPTLQQLVTATRFFQDSVCRHLQPEVPAALLRFLPLPPDERPKALTNAAHSPSPAVDDEAWALFLKHEHDTCPLLQRELEQFHRDQNPDHLTTVRHIFHQIRGESGFCGITHMARLTEAVEHHLESETPPSLDYVTEACTWLSAAFVALRTGTHLPDPVPQRTTPPLANVSGTQDGAVADIQPSTRSVATQTGEGQTSPSTTTVHTITVTDPDLSRDFVTEAREHFERADQALIELETNPESGDAMGAVFRAFHTIKGIAAFLAMDPIRELCHEVETLLDQVRKGLMTFEGDMVETTFRSLDLLKVLVEAVDANLTSGAPISVPGTFDPLLMRLRLLATPVSSRPQAAPPQPSTTSGVPADDARIDDALKPATGPANAASTQNVMRVASAKLDILLDTIGELVIAETVVSEDETLQAVGSARLGRNLSLLRKITRSLQSMGMALRMVPVDGLFRKMARLIRDLSKQSGKAVTLQLEGTDIELDKTIVERLGDPLIHMIRNAVDHGIEANPADRVKAGKPAEATITLRAQQRGANIHISVSDDGRGIQRHVLLKKGLEMGLIPDSENVTDADIFSLMFVPGFSTARAITDVSGRGVGMDVVRRDIMAVRGSITVESTPGKGTTFTLILPLTLAIIDGMSVRVGHETYIIPMLSIIECFRPESNRIHTAVGRAEMLDFRDRYLPLVRCGAIFGIQTATTDPTKGIVVVVEDGDRQLALLVDALIGQQQTVIKPLGEGMGVIPGISGATILGNGNPALVLDVASIMGIATGRKGQHLVGTGMNP